MTAIAVGVEFLLRTGGVGLAVVLLVGAHAHLRDPILISHVLPSLGAEFLRPMALFVALIEFLVGAALLSTSLLLFPIAASTLAAATVYLAFLLVLGIRYMVAPGSRCGCSRDGRATVPALLRGVIFAAVSLAVAYAHMSGGMSATGLESWQVGVAGLAGLVSGYVAWLLPDAIDAPDATVAWDRAGTA